MTITLRASVHFLASLVRTVPVVLLCACNGDDEAAKPVPASTVPIVSTSSIVSVIRTNALVEVKIVSDGGKDIIERGVLWFRISPPITEYKVLGPEQDEFYVDIENLEPETTYAVRAFATNNVGVGYGETKIVTTKKSTWFALNGRYDIMGGSIVRNSAGGPYAPFSGDYPDVFDLAFITFNEYKVSFKPCWVEGSTISMDDVRVEVNTTTNQLILSSTEAGFEIYGENTFVPGYPTIPDASNPQEFILNFKWGFPPDTRVITDLRVRYNGML